MLTIQGLLRASCSSGEGSPTGKVAGDSGEAGFSSLSPLLCSWTCFVSRAQVAMSCRAGFMSGAWPRASPESKGSSWKSVTPAGFW